MKEWSYTFAAVKGVSGLVYVSQDYFDRAISTLGFGEAVTVTVAKPQDKRSLAQNRGLWGPIYDQVAEVVGYDRHDKIGKEHMHVGLCMEYGGVTTDPVTGREVQKFHTSKATVQEMSDFIEWIPRFMADKFKAVIVLPGEL